MVDQVLLVCTFLLLFLMLLTLYLVVGGPSVLDRILGGNMVGTKTTVLLLLVGVLYDDLAMFVDIAIAYALLNFIATLGATKFFLRKHGSNEILEAALEDHAELIERSENRNGGS